MRERSLHELFALLRDGNPEEAWSEFVDGYSQLLLKVVRTVERDEDQASDCFLYVCQELSRSRFRRLKRFDPGGPASFSTWLTVVVRNLCLDWERRRYGRLRLPVRIQRLGFFEQDVFRCVFVNGLSFNQTHLTLQNAYPNLTTEELAAGLQEIEGRFSSAQRWSWLVRRTNRGSLEIGLENGPVPPQIPDPRPDPEEQLALDEKRKALSSALEQLDADDRLLIRLRYERGLTLRQVAEILNLDDPWKANRRIQKALTRLRQEIGDE